MCLGQKSLYTAYRKKSAGNHFYGTEYEIWAAFKPIGNTEEKIGADYQQIFWGAVFLCFQGQKGFLYKYCSTKSFYKTFFDFFSNSFLAPNGLNFHNHFFLALLETPPCTTSI